MSSSAADVVIIGGGIVGAACAWALARESLQVTLIDADTAFGMGVTAAGMGHVVVMDDSEAQFALTRYSRELWRELIPQLPAACEVDPAGTLWVAADADEMSAVRQKACFYESRGVEVEILDATTVAEAEPHLRPGLAGGLRVPGDFVVYAPAVARWLAEAARAMGAELLVGKKVARATGARVELEDGAHRSAAVVVNAAGAAAVRLTPGLDIRPRKGHLVITDRYPGFVRHQLIELGYLKSAHSIAGDSVAFNIQPRRTGQLLIGSSRQYDKDTLEVEPPILERMLRRAIEYMPRLAEVQAIRTWTGLRAATLDKLPLVGPWPHDPGLYIAAGHEGLGITTSLATAQLLTDAIVGRASAIPREPYLPARSLTEATHG